MSRWLRRIGLGIVALTVAALLAGWWYVRASLPQLDGEIVTDGLAASVLIERDAIGVPTITASSREDLAFATGFVHAQDRYFQMDTIRRQSAGELSALVGSATIGLDKAVRLHRFRSRAIEILRGLKREDRAILEQYAKGANAGLQSLDTYPFEYRLLGMTPEPWRAEDSLLVVFAMYLQLNDSKASKEVQRGRARSVLSERVYEWMYPDGTPWDAPIEGSVRGIAELPGPTELSLRGVSDAAPAANERGRRHLPGSNNWAVSGALTSNGKALVSNDMHLGLRVPNIYYRLRLVETGLQARDVSGASLPGTPFVVAGSNTYMAWGYTNSYGDYTDAVIVRPGSTSETYLTPDGEQSFERFTETIDVKGGQAIHLEVRETVWGPVLPEDTYVGHSIAVSWIAHHAGAININLMQLETARSTAQALTIANTMAMPPQNFVSGDADGNIGWTIAGTIPKKSEFDAELPADWSREQGWQGWLPADEYPRIYNPVSGRLWTANARVVDGESLQVIGDGGYDLGARARQIRDSLFANESFDAADMLALQNDDKAVFLSPWRDLLLTALRDDVVADDAELQAYRQLLVDWLPRAHPDAVGYRLVRAFRLEVQRRLFYALMQPVRAEYGEDVKLLKSNQFEAPLWAMLMERPLHLLPDEYADWDAFLLNVVRQNIDYYSTNYSGPLSDRTWGELNTAAIHHPLSSAIPLLGRYLNMPADPLAGDSNMPRAQGPAFGASERFSVYPGDEANSLYQMPGGQSGHPLSPFFDRGHDDWVNGRPAAFLPGVVQHRLTLLPN